MDRTAAHVRWEGRVQGVGFRATVRRSCTTHYVTGWVSNLDDGAVEAYLFGDRDSIQRALDGIAVSGHSIEHTVVNAEVASTLVAPQSFEIRR